MSDFELELSGPECSTAIIRGLDMIAAVFLLIKQEISREYTEDSEYVIESD